MNKPPDIVDTDGRITQLTIMETTIVNKLTDDAEELMIMKNSLRYSFFLFSKF